LGITVHDVQAFKRAGQRFAMLTAYDYTTASILDKSGIPLILVGDSLGMVVLGYDNTLSVTLDDMIHHTKAVCRGVSNAMVIADMPFMSYQVCVQQGVRNAGRLIKESGAQAVKIEGGRPFLELVSRLVDIGIPVMGHLGLTPQFVNVFGGFKVQGKTSEDAQLIYEDALALEQAGAFAIVLEGIPADLAKRITEAVKIPTIGIGAGPHTDGQVLVVNDMLGFTCGRVPKFVKTYANLAQVIEDAVKAYMIEVVNGKFPDLEHTYQVRLYDADK
jgi:3-methyl-2-oxobutanoate hydroxymethyltransferase